MSEDATLDEFVSAEDGEESDTELASGERIEKHPRFESLPSEWRIEEISDIAEVVGGSTPSTKNDDYWGGGIPWATPTDITALSGNTIEETADTLTQEGLESASTHLLPPRSVLMTSRATIGECAVNTVEMATNQGFKSLVPKEGVETWYLHYRMLETASFLESLGAGSTFDEVSKSVVQSVDVPIPPLEEQRKIATVLYTVDQAIQKTEEIIEQTERVQKGVRQDIFSRGIDESEQLRKEDDQYQETYLGVLPDEWELRQVDTVCSHVVDCPHSTPEYADEGILVVRTSEIEDGRFDPTEAPRVTEEGYEKRISRLEPEPGDVIFTREAPIGEAFKIPEGMKLCLGQRIMQLRPKEGVLDPDFLLELLYSDIMQNWFERSARGTTSKHINVGDMESLKIPIPPIAEQQRIDSVLGTYREQLDSEREYLNRLNRLKQGLMQDLLSGTVRTTDTNIEVPGEIAQHG